MLRRRALARATCALLCIALLVSGCVRPRTQTVGVRADSPFGAVLVEPVGLYPQGESLTGMRVRLKHLETEERRYLVVGSDEPVLLTDVPPGRYEIKLSAGPLGEDHLRREVRIRAGETIRIYLFDHGEDWEDHLEDVGETALEVGEVTGKVILVVVVVTAIGAAVAWASLESDEDDEEEHEHD